MTRLRLAPSSPERMAGLVRRLFHRHGVAGRYWTRQSEWEQGAAERGARLLLRWFSHAQERHRLRYYRLVWCTTYPDQRWPPDGDERLRKELSE